MPNQPLSSGSARRNRSQAIAFGVIRGLSFLTIAILALILGFILFKGFRYSNETRSAVLPYAERAPDGLVVVVNEKTDFDHVEFPTLFGMFTDEYINWANITADDYDLLPVAVDPSTPEGLKAERLLFGSPEAAQWGSLVKTVPDVASALKIVATTPGAVTIVPQSAVGSASSLVVVPLRRLVLAANQSVLELVDNKQVEDMNDATIARVLSGSVKNWKDLGGPDMAVRVVAPPAGSELAAVAAAAGLKASGTPAATMDQALSSLANDEGTVGPYFANLTQANNLSTLTRIGVERGWNLTLRYLLTPPRLSGRVGGISTIIVNSLFMLLLTLLMVAPIGVGAAIYLVEYAKQGPLVRLLRLGTETLAGIPSIIFGLFGFLVFVDKLHFGFGLLSGCLTLTLMILPPVIRTTEESLKSVPQSLREGSLALGATKLQTIFRVTVPAAAPGILTGLILGVGRALGETAALLFTMGSDYKLAKGLFSSARVLSSHVYLLFAEGISFDRAFSTATVLIIVVLAFNFAARRLIGRMNRFAAS